MDNADVLLTFYPYIHFELNIFNDFQVILRTNKCNAPTDHRRILIYPLYTSFGGDKINLMKLNIDIKKMTFLRLNINGTFYDALLGFFSRYYAKREAAERLQTHDVGGKIQTTLFLNQHMQ